MAAGSKTYVWRSPEGLGRAAVIVLGAKAVAELAQAIFMAAAGPAAGYAGARTMSGLQLSAWLFDLLQLLLLLATAVCPFWIYRACENAQLLRPRPSVGPWGSVLWWIVPFASLYMPVKAMGEIMQASALDRKNNDGAVLAVWWTCSIASGMASWMILLAQKTDPSPGLSVAMHLAPIPSTVLFAYIVRRVSVQQPQKRVVEAFYEPAAGGLVSGLERFTR